MPEQEMPESGALCGERSTGVTLSLQSRYEFSGMELNGFAEDLVNWGSFAAIHCDLGFLRQPLPGETRPFNLCRFLNPRASNASVEKPNFDMRRGISLKAA